MDMKRVKDLTGNTYGRWSVVKFAYAKGNAAYWDCKCECGAEKAVFGGDLKRGMSTSCGCLAREKQAARMTRHGMAGTPGYHSWVYMKDRCNNPASDGYPQYGGRGIVVCEAWSTFEGFWADMGSTWADGLSIDRYPDKNGNYEPGNCRWATPQQQARNRRTERLIETPSGLMCVAEAGETFGVSPITISSRLRYGWTDPAKLVAPPRGRDTK